MALFAAALATSRASTITLTMNGTVSGTDTSGMWGYAPGMSIPAGTPFSLAFSFNDQLGTKTQSDGPGNSYIETLGTSNPGSATLMINNNSFTFAATGRPNLLSEIVQNNSPANIIQFTVADGYDGNGSNVQVSATPTSYKLTGTWETSVPKINLSVEPSTRFFNIQESAELNSNGELTPQTLEINGTSTCQENISSSNHAPSILQPGSCPASLKITSPDAAANFSFTESNSTATASIPFTATGTTGQAIDWSLALTFSTTGGYGPFTNKKTFATQSDQPANEQYTSMGGQVTATATQGSATDQVVFTITGVQIADGVITTQLINLYTNNGSIKRATPNLMTGIAYAESSYAQFTPNNGQPGPGLWPHESPVTEMSPRAGSHIGLMQVEVNMQVAWDWLANTQAGTTLFVNHKLATAELYLEEIQKQHTGLPHFLPLSIELENMALVLYGPYAHSSLDEQYYAPQCNGKVEGSSCKGGMWTWVVNTAGNPKGVKYADSIRSLLK